MCVLHSVCCDARVDGVGNYLNGGTSRGGAFGFKIDILPKLSAIKTIDNKLSMIDYVVVVLEHSAATASVVANLEHVSAADRVVACGCLNAGERVRNWSPSYRYVLKAMSK